MRRRTAVVLLAAGAAAAAVAAHRRRAAAPPARAAAPVEGRRRTVRTADGVELHVEEHGPADGAATWVLGHGYVQSSRLWDGQVRDLLAARPDVRVVVYDHRGHGRSGRTERAAATIEQLGRDLAGLLDDVVPTGPLLLGGHSMGGMTIMALAEQQPELFAERVVGVALVATSSGGLAEETYGLPRPVARAVAKALPALNERAVRREAAGRARKTTAADAWLLFGRGADPGHVATVLQVQQENSAETVAAFGPTFSAHDRSAALEVLAHVPTVVVVGDGDRLTPLAHSQRIAAALPRSELVVLPGVGHMVHIERRAEVSRLLVALTDRALRGGAAAEGARPTAPPPAGPPGG